VAGAKRRDEPLVIDEGAAGGVDDDGAARKEGDPRASRKWNVSGVSGA
jgi:hypothetical protein